MDPAIHKYLIGTQITDFMSNPQNDPAPTDIGEISGTGKDTWGWEFPPEQVAEEIIAAQIQSVYDRTDISGEQKQMIVDHLSGFGQQAMQAILTKYFSTGPGNQIQQP